MSQISKKGKSLSRKRNVKQENNEKELLRNTPNEDLREIFNIQSSLSTKYEDKDNSLHSVDTPLKYGSCFNRCDSDEVKFSNKSEICFKNKCIRKEENLETEIKTIGSKTIFNEETVIGDSTVDGFKFPVEATSVFDDSSFVFKSDSNDEENKPVSNIKATNDCRATLQIDHNTLLDEEVSISYPIWNESNSAEDKDAVDTREESENNILKQCPICFKTTTNNINHMKSCAAKNNLTTQQLLSVLKLHKKQIAERKELGLGPPAPSFRAKVSPKRTKAINKKVTIDSNLQLALALSASLHSAEENELIQEAEALKEAGLSDEADKKLSTLEKYAFASELPSVSRNVKGIGSFKTRPIVPPLLIRRTKEDRERIVTEKVAIVLISEEESPALDPFTERRPTIKSKRLLKLWTENCELWNKAHCPGMEQRDAFYIQTLSKFIEPSTAEVGEGLRRLSQVPGRLNTPVKDNMSDLYLCSPLQDFSGTKKGLSSASTVQRYSVTPDKTNKLSEDWRNLVGNSFLSDICVHCNQGEVIPAHKLVFYVRCPAVLNIAVKHDSGKDAIILDSYTKGSVLSFLEYVYSGNSDKIQYLSSEELHSLINLTEKCDYSELNNYLLLIDKSGRNGENKSKGKHVIKELFGNCSNAQDDNEDSKSKLNSAGRNGSAENDCKNLNLDNDSDTHSLKGDYIGLDCLSPCIRKGSPDMFEDSDVLNTKYCSPEKDDLAMLASLVGKTCTQVNNDNDKSMSHQFDDVNCSNTLSLSGSSSMKRKALSSSLSENEDVVQRKKVRTVLLKSATSEDTNEDEAVLDLTQSSSSSKGESSIKNDLELGTESDDCKIVSTILDESLEELTQQNPSSPTSPCVQHVSQTRDVADSFNNDCPAWGGFEDDCWYYNYDNNTPMRNSSLKECSVTKLGNKSPKILSDLNYISSASKSSDKYSQKSLSPCSSVSSVKNISTIKDKSTINHYQKTPEVCQISFPDDFEGNKSILHSSDDTKAKHSPKVKSKHFKTRKNLSFQFNSKHDVQCLEEDISSINFTESQKSPVQNISIASEKVENECSKTPYKKNSLAAIQRLLDDSFEINDSKLISIDALASNPVNTCVDKSNICGEYPSANINGEEQNNSAVTPSQEIYVSDNVTPLPSYSSMKTPTLKKELKRFGLKPSLAKGKAKLLLRHIYDQTHPFIAEPVNARTEFKRPEGQPPRSPTKMPHHNLTTVDLVDSETDEPCSQPSTCSSMSSSTTLPEESLFQSEEDLIKQTQIPDGDIRTSVRNLILSDPKLHQKILMYEPVFVEDLMAMLKNKGIKSKSDQIIKFLDEQCITFRTSSWKTRNEKNRKRKEKKKAKSANSGERSRSTELSPKQHELSPTKAKQSKSGRQRRKKN